MLNGINTSPFNAQAYGTPVAFTAVKDTDSLVSYGSIGQKIKIQCISCMTEYNHKSMEELRFEDYMLNRKGVPTSFGVGTTTNNSMYPTFSQFPTPSNSNGTIRLSGPGGGISNLFGNPTPATTIPMNALFPSLARITNTSPNLFRNFNNPNAYAKFPTAVQSPSSYTPFGISTATPDNNIFSTCPNQPTRNQNQNQGQNQNAFNFGNPTAPIPPGNSPFQFNPTPTQPLFPPSNVPTQCKPFVPPWSPAPAVINFDGFQPTHQSALGQPQIQNQNQYYNQQPNVNVSFPRFTTPEYPFFPTSPGFSHNSSYSGSSVMIPPELNSPYPPQWIATTPYPELPPPNCDHATFAKHMSMAAKDLAPYFHFKNRTTPTFSPPQPICSQTFGKNKNSIPTRASGFRSTNPPLAQNLGTRDRFAYSGSITSDDGLFTFEPDPLIPRSRYDADDVSKSSTLTSSRFSVPSLTPPRKPKNKNELNDVLKRISSTTKELTRSNYRKKLQLENTIDAIIKDGTNYVPVSGENKRSVSANKIPLGSRRQRFGVLEDFDEEDEEILKNEEAQIPIGIRVRRRKVGDEPSPILEDEVRSSGVKLTKKDYYCHPPVVELDRLTDQHGNCFIEGFIVGHTEWGVAKFEGGMNVAGLDLDKLVKFAYKEFTVYPSNEILPKPGEGLNRACSVTLEKIWPWNAGTLEKIMDVNKLKKIGYEKCLRKACERFGGEFVSYVPHCGSWTFRVSCFPQ